MGSLSEVALLFVQAAGYVTANGNLGTMMVRFGHLPIVAAVVFAAAICLSTQAQTAVEETPAAGTHFRVVPPVAEPMPFSTTGQSGSAVLSIEFRPADRMTESDRELAADAESSIAEHARFNGMDFTQGKWSYEQVVCPALPNHLFLQYTRNTGVGDATVFSASIPRNGEGRVRIVPILKRGYSLFSPAPINALTISAFNHIRAEERAGRSSSWVGNGLCYAALAGTHPRIPDPDEMPAIHKPVPALGAILEVRVKGGEVIRFADANARPHPMEWTMTFTEKGRLIKATHSQVAMVAAKPVPEKSAVMKTRTVPNAASE
jgi:hypothetical protein